MSITTDDFITHFVWSGLNTEFQSHLTSITNKCKPGLDDINTNIFEATDRYVKQLHESKDNRFDKHRQVINKPMHQDSSANAMVIKDAKSNVYCCLCSYDKIQCDHLLKDCTVYVSPRDKFDKLRIIGACTKCSFVNHETTRCKFKFKSNCRYCSAEHMSYLCLKSAIARKPSESSPDSRSVISKVSRETTNNLSLIESTELSAKNAMFLPTFSADLLTDDQNYFPVRVFKDSGCQSTFICSALAERMQLPIMEENIPLTVHGFNSSKNIITKSVQVKLKIGKNVFTHNAICVENTKASFSVSRMGEIISAFESRGFKLADKDFSAKCSGNIENVDFILGTDADHMLSMKYKTFGDPSNKNELSSFIDTPIGVILSGNVDKMIRNLTYLTWKYPGDSGTLFNMTNSGILPLENAREYNSSALNEVELNTVLPLETRLKKLRFNDANDLLSGDLLKAKSDPNDQFSGNKFDFSSGIFSENGNSENDCTLLDSKSVNTKVYVDVCFSKLKDGYAKLLSQNYSLARKLMDSDLEVTLKRPDKFRLFNDVFNEQRELQITAEKCLEKLSRLANE